MTEPVTLTVLTTQRLRRYLTQGENCDQFINRLLDSYEFIAKRMSIEDEHEYSIPIIRPTKDT